MIKMPVLDVKLVNISDVVANDYNPNKVATPEMKLLKHSIQEDGYTQPIVTMYDDKKEKYVVIDGFHRYTVGMQLGLDEIPIVVIDKEIKDRMASTIRHNRARGTHQILDMSKIVTDLYVGGWSDSEISKHLGMDADEVIRLKQVSGLKEAFADHEFSNSWEMFKKNLNKTE